MKWIIISYDISSNKFRYNIVKLFESYGIRIQKSIFEFKITQKQYEILKDKIEKLSYNEEKEYSIIILDLHLSSKIVVYGEKEKLENEDIIF